MNLALPCFLFLLGIGLIVKGGDLFVTAAGWMARASGMPQFLIGATVVSVATTLPEIIVSCMAAADGSTAMAIGNAVGSVCANTGLILALCLVVLPHAIARRQLWRKGLLMLASCALLWLFCRDGSLALSEGLWLLALFALFIAENIHSASRTEEKAARPAVQKGELGKNLVFFLAGAAALVIGSDLLVDNGSLLALLLGVPERLIAITMVAIGTSLPELVTAITALVKKQGGLSVGNILGANIIDITVILPLCGMISGGALPVSPLSVQIDLPICLAEACLAVIPTLILRRFTRLQGLLMLLVYLSYLAGSILL